MAYISTVDERYFGSYLSNPADTYDANSTLNEVFVLAESEKGYGNLTSAYISDDLDIYSLGILDAGKYVVDVDQTTWDYSSSSFGSVSEFGVLNALGNVVVSSTSTYTDIDFFVSSASSYYVYVTGGNFLERQYSVEYSSIPNYDAVWSSGSFSGTLQPGNDISASGLYFDINGAGDGSLDVGWVLDGAFQGIAETFSVTSEHIGQTLSFVLGFYDGDGYYEVSPEYTAGEITAANSAAVFSNPGYTGSLVAGTDIVASITYSDADGNSDNIMMTGWYLDDGDLTNGIDTFLEDYTSFNNTITLQSDWVGQTLYFTKGFEDDLGNLESSWSDPSNTIGIYEVGEIFENNAPTVTSTSPYIYVTEGTEFSYTFTASDVDAGDKLTLSAETKPDWLSFNLETGVLSGTPNNDAVGWHSVTLRVTDVSGSYTDQSFSLSVIRLNDAPTITTTTFLTTSEDTSTSAIAFSGSDADGDSVTFSFGDPVKGTVVDNDDGTFTYTPDANANGSDSFLITASDGIVGVNQAISVAISAVNDAPTVSSDAVTTATEDTEYSYTFTAVDVDENDTVTKSTVNLPSWLSFNAETGVLSGTPTNAEVGEHAVTLRVTDEAGEFEEQSFTITVENVNDAPTITSEAVLDATENGEYTYTLSASDVDGDSITLTAIQKPDWLDFTASDTISITSNGNTTLDGGIVGTTSKTATLSGTPTENDVGTSEIILRAEDADGLYVEQSFSIEVKDSEDVTNNQTVNISIGEDTPTGLALQFKQAQIEPITQSNDGEDVVVVATETESRGQSVNNGALDVSDLTSFNFDHVKLESSTYSADIAISDVISSLKHIVGLETLDGAALHAADVDNDDTLAIADVISQLKHIVGLETLDTFDLVDTAGARVTEITEETTDLQLVLNGDVDMSTALNSEYVYQV